MAQYNFEGDFDNINERQLEFINKVIQEQRLQVKTVVFGPVGQTGDGFVASVKRIHVKGENGDLKMIGKIASGYEMIRNFTSTEQKFQNEHTMYMEVLPKLVQLQKDAGVPDEEQLKYAKCYGSLTEAPNEVILLEDLNELGFSMLDKFEPLPNECVKSIIKNFALLHSLSFVLKNREPETYDLFTSKLSDMWVLMSQDKDMMSNLKIFQKDLVTNFEDETHKRLLKNLAMDAFSQAVEFSKKTDNTYSIISQGEAWTNNIMFKMGDESAQSIMIDYQASNNSSPAIDLLFMIFNCTDHETRSKNYYNWIDYYHTELDNSLSNYSLKADSVYPRNQLNADLKRHAKLLFGMSVMLANLLMRDSEETSKIMDVKEYADFNDAVESMKMEAMPVKTYNRFKNRVVGLIKTVTELDLLENH